MNELFSNNLKKVMCAFSSISYCQLSLYRVHHTSENAKNKNPHTKIQHYNDTKAATEVTVAFWGGPGQSRHT